jgi:hypothetical protein
MSMVKHFEEKTMSEKILDKKNYTNVDGIPICLEKKTSKAIRTRSLSEAKLGNGFSDFIFIRDTKDRIVFRIRN